MSAIEQYYHVPHQGGCIYIIMFQGMEIATKRMIMIEGGCNYIIELKGGCNYIIMFQGGCNYIIKLQGGCNYMV